MPARAPDSRHGHALSGVSGKAAAHGARSARVGPRGRDRSCLDSTGRDVRARRAVSQGCICSQPQSSMPISRRRPPFPWRTSSDPRRASRSRSESASASWTRSPARQSTTTIARSRQPWRSSRAWRITATISSTVAGSAGYKPLVARRPSRVVARHGRRRTMPTGGIEHCGNGHECSSHETADNSARPLPAEPSPLLGPESRVDRTLPLPLHPGERAPRDARGDGRDTRPRPFRAFREPRPGRLLRKW